jgi:hypothetical protein
MQWHFKKALENLLVAFCNHLIDGLRPVHAGKFSMNVPA